MSTALVSVTVVSPTKPRPVVHERDVSRRFTERRLTPRVTLASPLPCHLEGLGTATIRAMSLKGATLSSSFRPAQPSVRVRLVYGDVCIDTDALVYQTLVDELFYSTELGSRVRFLSSVTFDNPSVAALNLLYRILGDHWIGPGDDDTTPVDR